jgi:hypothetical protein
MENKELTVDELASYLVDELDKKLVPQRKMILSTGKKGVLEYIQIFYRKIGCSEDTVQQHLDKYEKELPEGCYIIDSSQIDNLGITYNGNY